MSIEEFIADLKYDRAFFRTLENTEFNRGRIEMLSDVIRRLEKEFGGN